MADKFNEALQDAAKTEATALAKATGDARLIADVAGIFDPTPTCDAVSVVMSLWNMDWIDAGLGVVSMIPYVGDFFAKPAKFVRRFGEPGVRIVNLTKAWFHGKTDDLLKALKHNPKAIEDARKKAAKAVQDAQQKKRLGCNTEECKKVRKANMPKETRGTWDPPNARDLGTGKFTFIDKDGVQRTVSFKDGYPEFSTPTGRFHIDNPTKNADAGIDGDRLVAQYPDAFPGGKPPDTTLHHFEDGTIGFVDSAVHDIVPHAGFRSIQKTDLY